MKELMVLNQRTMFLAENNQAESSQEVFIVTPKTIRWVWEKYQFSGSVRQFWISYFLGEELLRLLLISTQHSMWFLQELQLLLLLLQQLSQLQLLQPRQQQQLQDTFLMNLLWELQQLCKPDFAYFKEFVTLQELRNTTEPPWTQQQALQPPQPLLPPRLNQWFQRSIQLFWRKYSDVFKHLCIVIPTWFHRWFGQPLLGVPLQPQPLLPNHWLQRLLLTPFENRFVTVFSITFAEKRK